MLIRVFGALIIIIILTLGVFLFVSSRVDYSEHEPSWGITFSPTYAEELKLDPKEVFLNILDDLNITYLRLPGYWDRIEKSPGVYNFDELDWMVNEAAARDVQILLVLGQRQPRWPECHFPKWAKGLPDEAREESVLKFIEQVVKRYQGNKNIYAWQVENEPLLNLFGKCPAGDFEFLKTEVELVRSLDSRPIVLSESGELSTWVRSASIADIVAVSMYEVTWNRYLGYLYYPLTPGFYHQKITLIKPMVDKVICSELQAEPWATTHIMDMTKEQMEKGMTLEMIGTNMDLAKRAGFKEIYLWGAEWWYFMKKEFGNDTYWQKMKELWR